MKYKLVSEVLWDTYKYQLREAKYLSEVQDIWDSIIAPCPWIKVSDRLPEEGEQVYIWFDYDKHPSSANAAIHLGDGEFIFDQAPTIKAKHWLPLNTIPGPEE